MDRIVVKRSATLSRTFAFTPTGTPTVALARVSDGTAVTASSMSGSATSWSYTIPASSNTLLDTYVETITAQSGGEAQTFTDTVEVAGGVLFTLAEARALKPLDSVTAYPDSTILEMRTTVEQALEEACQVAFVPRYERETVTGTGMTSLFLKWPKIRAIRAASSTYAGSTTTLTPTDLSYLTADTAGVVTGYSWTYGYPWTVGYEHGYDRPPEEIRRAGLILAKLWLTSASRPIDDRAITFNASEGGTYSLAVPGRNGSFFGHPDVDAAIQRYSLAVGVA